MKVKSRESRVKSRTMRCFALSLAVVLPAAVRSQAQCYIDPVTGEQVCAQAPKSIAGGRALALDSRLSTLDPAAHCRITVADGSTGSGTLIAVDESVGLVLTCSHLFDGSTGRIVVSFPNGERFGAGLIDRDKAHDLAALAIRRPNVTPIDVSETESSGPLAACGFGPQGKFRCVQGAVTGQAVATGAVHPSLTIAGAVRPGDSGGGVLDPGGRLVWVVWGQRDGLTYATCGQPVREFLDRIRGKRFVASPHSSAPSPQLKWQESLSKIESQISALDQKKQDKGPYLKPEDLRGYLRIADAPNVDANQFAKRSELDGKITTLLGRISAVQQRVERVAAGKGGIFQGLSFGKLVVGALGLSGPLAAAVVMAGGLAGRRAKKRISVDHKAEYTERGQALVRYPQPIAVDTPPPPQRTVPETHYVSVEKDSFAKAHQWASEHVARKYPGASEILQALDSLIKQYLAAN